MMPNYFNILTNDWVTKIIGEWADDPTNIFAILFRITLAIIFAGAIGVERAKKRHSAGFRTYMLVCLGATMVMILNDYLFYTHQTGDIARLGAQVISGVGFLGAGTILVTSGSRIKGLTTAAGLWTSACMGLAIGAGFYTLAIVAGLLIFVILSLMPKVESYLRRRSKFLQIYVELETRKNLKDLINLLREQEFKVISIEKNPAFIESGLSVYSIMLSTQKNINHRELINDLQNLEYVNCVDELN